MDVHSVEFVFVRFSPVFKQFCAQLLLSSFHPLGYLLGVGMDVHSVRFVFFHPILFVYVLEIVV